MLCTSCADDSGTEPGPEGLQLVEVSGAPEQAAEPESIEHELPAYASSIGATDHLLIVGTSSGALAFGGDVPVFLGPENVTVDAFASAEDGLLVFMKEEVAFTTGASVESVSGLDALAAIGVKRTATRWIAAANAEDPPVPHHTLIAADAAYEFVNGALTRWPVEGEEGAPTAAFAGEKTLLIAYESRLYEIDRETKMGRLVALDLGDVEAIACDASSCGEESLFYLATSRGLVERVSSSTYVLYPLANDGEAPAPVRGFALDAIRQRLYAWTDDALLLVRSSGVPQSVGALETDATLPRVGAVDSVGDLWVGNGTSLSKFETGTPLSFATDIQPIMGTYCATCHQAGIEGAPTIDFESYDVAKARVDRIVARMSEATMPPASSPAVPADKLKLVLTWATDVAP